MTASSWTRLFAVPAGGLSEIGFDPHEKYLLVVSHNGRGLFDAATGVRLARDYAEPTLHVSWLRPLERLAQGIGPADTTWFPVVGLWGGCLPNTFGPWLISVRSQRRTASVLISTTSGAPTVLDEPITEIRAVGFTPSGRALLATSSDIQAFGEPHAH